MLPILFVAKFLIIIIKFQWQSKEKHVKNQKVHIL